MLRTQNKLHDRWDKNERTSITVSRQSNVLYLVVTARYIAGLYLIHRCLVPHRDGIVKGSSIIVGAVCVDRRQTPRSRVYDWDQNEYRHANEKRTLEEDWMPKLCCSVYEVKVI